MLKNSLSPQCFQWMLVLFVSPQAAPSECAVLGTENACGADKRRDSRTPSPTGIYSFLVQDQGVLSHLMMVSACLFSLLWCLKCLAMPSAR